MKSDVNVENKDTVHEHNIIAHNLLAKYHDELVSYSRLSANNCHYFRTLKKFYSRSLKGKKVLEIACGTGIFTDNVMHDGACSYHGFDISPKMVYRANEKNTCRNVTYSCSSFEDFIKINRCKYDLVFSYSFIHHLHDLTNFREQILSLLDEDGIYCGLHEPDITARFGILASIDSFAYKKRCQLQKVTQFFKEKNFSRAQYPEFLSSKFIDYQLEYGAFDEFIKGQETIRYPYYDFLPFTYIFPNNYNAVIIRKNI